jgi:tetratricopeptide (TPR) repeat protein/transcriptional regulator with XRE-family HTH domain
MGHHYSGQAMTEDTVTFGALVGTFRRSAGLSQEDLAKRSGLSVRAVGDLERGRTRAPHPGTVRRLAGALGLGEEDSARFRAAVDRPLSGRPLAPAQLPGPVRQFTGRRDELAALTSLLRGDGDDGDGDGPTALVISAIAGTAGVGKSALAVQWAHQMAGNFPDGQLYADLHGFDPSGRPAEPSEVLAGFLRALGVAPQDIPAREAEQAAAYRTQLAGRRMLVLLDNAGSADQVRTLLPGSVGCVTLVTSRDALAGLAARDGAVRLELDLLPLPEAVALLCGLIDGRAERDPDATGQLAILCGRLPLALRVAAELANSRPAIPLADLVDELADLQHRLELLDCGGDERTAVQAAFAWSYRSLSPEAARLFRLAGIHPGPELSIAAAASLTQQPVATARQALSELTRAHLLAECTPGRFSCHDLLRAYAAGLAGRHEQAAARQAVVRRVLDHYLHTSHAAALLLSPHRAAAMALPPPSPGVVPEQLDDDQQALAWFETEHQVLLACTYLAAETGYDACACLLPWAMTEFLDRRGHWHEWAATQRIALAAATRLGNMAGQAVAHRAIATACIRLTDYRRARVHLAGCLRLRRQLGDRTGEAMARHSLGRVAEHQGRYTDALRHEQQALGLFRDADDQAGQALALNAIGWYHTLLGHPQQAMAVCQRALTLYRQAGHRVGQAQAWDSLGYAEHQLGRLDHATACYQNALDIFRGLGELYSQADTLTRLGDTRAAAHDLPAAQDAWHQALNILEMLSHPDVARVRTKLGRGSPPSGRRDGLSPHSSG